MASGPTIELRAITRRFGRTVALDGVSFDLRPREVLGLLGPNGAGKTTTLRVLTGYLRPDAGSIVVDGVDMTDDEVGRKRLFGYAPESSALYPEMTVEAYLRFWAKVRGVRRGDRADRVERSLRRTDLVGVARSRIGTLSLGFRQRVSLAQALVHDPPVLVLDEPTNGLDPRQAADARALVARLGRSRTVLLSSHRLGEVAEVCRRVAVLDAGRIVAVDEVDALTRQTGATDLEDAYLKLVR
jgi:ABC-2 type transport system ATP-binding protein